MTKTEQIMFFLGQVKVKVEQLVDSTRVHESPLHEKLSNLENFFNRSIDEIFYSDDVSTRNYNEPH